MDNRVKNNKFKAGGTGGVLAPMLKHLLESMPDGELDNHLDEDKTTGGSNRHNGKGKKTVRSMSGGSFALGYVYLNVTSYDV